MKPLQLDRSTAISLAAIACQLLLQVLIGFALGMHYRADVHAAHHLVEQLRSNFFWRTLANWHYWGSSILILHTGIHVVWQLWRGRYEGVLARHWYGALLFFAAAMLFQITGNLLPMDRHDVQTAVIETGISGQAPLIGDSVQSMMLNGNQFSQRTLTAWNWAHRWVAGGCALLALILISFGNLSPFAMRKNRFGVFFPALLGLVIALLISAPFGDAATAFDFQRYDTSVSWYVWPLHAMMGLWLWVSPSLGWVGSALVPGVLFAFLAGLPFLSKRMTIAAVQAVSLSFGMFFLIALVFFGGHFTPPYGDQTAALKKFNPTPQPAATAIDRALAAQGQKLFNEVGCSNCHGLNGGKAQGGPVLTRIYQEHADAAWYTEFIHNPKSKHPQSTMPAFTQLDDNQLKQLAEFLRSPHS